MTSISWGKGTRPWRAVITVTLMAVGGALTGCSSPVAPVKAAQSTTTTSLLTPAIVAPTLTINGHAYVVPTEDGVHAIDPSVATGSQIVITDKGLLPYRLFAQLSQKVVWTNLSSHPVRITFLHLPVKSGLIPVGGTFTYASPTLINFEYVASSGYHALVSIGSFTPS